MLNSSYENSKKIIESAKDWQALEISNLLKVASRETITWSHECSPLFVCKKRQYQGEIALVTNIRPLMSEQISKLGYILYYLNGEYIS